MNKRPLRGLLAAALGALVLPLMLRALAQDSPKGDEWETTTQMSMEGVPMQMPMQTRKVCAERDSAEPPAAAGAPGNCMSSGFETVDNKVTWAVMCTDPAMTGVGEIVYGDLNTYIGQIKFMSADGNMTIRLTGRKTGNECDNPQ